MKEMEPTSGRPATEERSDEAEPHREKPEKPEVCADILPLPRPEARRFRPVGVSRTSGSSAWRPLLSRLKALERHAHQQCRRGPRLSTAEHG